MEKKKKNNSNVDLEKSIERLENRLDCSMCSISGDMADVLTRVHKLEDNQVKIDDCKDDDSRYFLRNFALPIGKLALGGIIVLGFIGVTITIIRDAIISILGA